MKLVAERPCGVATETELGLRLDEAKQVTKSLQAEIVPAQIAALSAYP